MEAVVMEAIEVEAHRGGRGRRGNRPRGNRCRGRHGCGGHGYRGPRWWKPRSMEASTDRAFGRPGFGGRSFGRRSVGRGRCGSFCHGSLRHGSFGRGSLPRRWKRCRLERGSRSPARRRLPRSRRSIDRSCARATRNARRAARQRRLAGSSEMRMSRAAMVRLSGSRVPIPRWDLRPVGLPRTSASRAACSRRRWTSSAPGTSGCARCWPSARSTRSSLASLPNLTYISGFSGSAGLLIVTADRLYLLIDFRYSAAVARAAAGGALAPALDAVQIDGSYDRSLARWLAERSFRRVGFEASHLSVARHETWRREVAAQPSAPAIEWVPVEGAVEDGRLREGRL